MSHLNSSNYKAVIIGGSAGSFSVVSKMLAKIKSDFPLPIIICMHRLKHVRSGLVESLNIKSNIPVIEPFDKDKIEPGKVYLAPSNYHMFIEYDNTFSLSTEDVLNHSRPSIDHSFISAATTYRNKLIGIILTGANKDGALGMKQIHNKQGYTIVQDPSTCDVETMTKSALKLFSPDQILAPEKILELLNTL